ncbi:MAG TPA: 30S ribosomal protein S17 [Phycisphaerae bacterium]|nr:30S ribosomal protein S17 [Phycisphaerae bacterium]HPS53139.1 30S ribosomal protein S17 [Phycisphaerae bacterium]
MTNEAQKKNHNRRAKVGTVISKSGSKTVSVQIDNLVKHETYGKYLRRRTKLAVHDELEQAKVGDMVEIVPVRPLSKKKAHRLVRVVRPAVG